MLLIATAESLSYGGFSSALNGSPEICGGRKVITELRISIDWGRSAEKRITSVG